MKPVAAVESLNCLHTCIRVKYVEKRILTVKNSATNEMGVRSYASAFDIVALEGKPKVPDVDGDWCLHCPQVTGSACCKLLRVVGSESW